MSAVVAALAGCKAAESSLPPSSTAPAPAPSVAEASAPAAPVEIRPAAPGINSQTGIAAAEGLLDGQRPVAVTVMNSFRSLPQRGLAAADVLVEMLIDSAETRFLAVYGDYRAIPPVGPVCSSYDQFTQFSLPLDAIQVHIGKSQYAENLLTVLQQKDIDGIQLGKVAFWFDENRQIPRLTGKLNEYCWFTDANLIFNGMTYIDMPTVGAVPSLFNFGAGTDFVPSDEAHYVQGVFSGQSTSGFGYVPDLDAYTKTNFGGPHMDEDGTLLLYSNVFFLQVEFPQKPDTSMLDYDFRTGAGWYFTSGGLQPITWEKGDAQQPFRFRDSAGSELTVKPGKSYIGFVPGSAENAVTWQSAQQLAEAAAAAASAAPPVA